MLDKLQGNFINSLQNKFVYHILVIPFKIEQNPPKGLN